MRDKNAIIHILQLANRSKEPMGRSALFHICQEYIPFRWEGETWVLVANLPGCEIGRVRILSAPSVDAGSLESQDARFMGPEGKQARWFHSSLTKVLPWEGETWILVLVSRLVYAFTWGSHWLKTINKLVGKGHHSGCHLCTNLTSSLG